MPYVNYKPETTTTSPATDTDIRINCGSSSAFTDSKGKVWMADQYVTGGNTYTATTTAGLANTERYGSAFTYNIPCSDRLWGVELWFRESYWTAVGDRVFGVKINDSDAVMPTFDIVRNFSYRKVGLVTLLDQQRTWQGLMKIQFTAVTDSAVVSGIRLF